MFKHVGSQFEQQKEWDEVTRKIGCWVDLENPYITYENDYIETVWWIRKEFWPRDLIYHSYKILPFEILNHYNGSDLAYREYEPLFDFIEPPKKAYYTILGDFVTSDEGTSIVHIAPAFGEDDYQASQKYDLPIIHPVDKSGKFAAGITQLKGKLVKDADAEIIEDLRSRELLYLAEKITHSYPNCWRSDSPLRDWKIQ